MRSSTLVLLGSLLAAACRSVDPLPPSASAPTIEVVGARATAVGSGMSSWSFLPGTMRLLGDGGHAEDLRLVGVEELLEQNLVVATVDPASVVWRRKAGFMDRRRSSVMGLAPIADRDSTQRVLLVGVIEGTTGAFELDVGARTVHQIGPNDKACLPFLDGPLEEFEDLNGDGRREFVATFRGDELLFVDPSSGAALRSSPLSLTNATVSRLERVGVWGGGRGSGLAFAATNWTGEPASTLLGVVWPFSDQAGWRISFPMKSRYGLNVDLLRLVDLDGDDVEELVIDADLRGVQPAEPARVSCVSSRTGKLLWSTAVCDATLGLWSRMCLIDDRDGDGLRDVLVARQGGPPQHPFVVLSARDGRVLGSVAAPPEASSELGAELDSALGRDMAGELRCFVAAGDPREHDDGVVWLLKLEPPQR